MFAGPGETPTSSLSVRRATCTCSTPHGLGRQTHRASTAMSYLPQVPFPLVNGDRHGLLRKEILTIGGLARTDAGCKHNYASAAPPALHLNRTCMCCCQS